MSYYSSVVSIVYGLLPLVVRVASVVELAETVVAGIGASRTVVLARFWAAASDGIRLLASAGHPSGGGSYTRLDGEFREMAIRETEILRITENGQPFIVRGLRGDEDWLTNASWSARQGVRAVLVLPLVDRNRTVGVLAILDREIPSDAFLNDLALVANVAAARVMQLSEHSAPLPPSIEAAQPVKTLTVVTRSEMRAREKQNIEAALTQSNGKIFGADGAAALLGMRPTTLASRIRALGIR